MFLLRRYTVGQQTQEKMLNITYHQSSRKCKLKLPWDFTSHLSEMDKIKNSRNNKHWQGCRAKVTLLYCWWECKLVQPLWKTVWRFLKKLKKKTKLPYNLVITLLGIYPKNLRTPVWNDICTPVFIAVLFITNYGSNPSVYW